jgi:DNA-binding CsgD family transcriptional regulator
LKTFQVDVNELGGSRIAEIADQELIRKVNGDRLRYLTVEQMKHLTEEQVQMLKDSKQMADLPELQFNQLKTEQLVAAIQHTSDAQEKMSKETVQGITKKELFDLLQPSLRDLLTDSQLKTFQVDVNELGESRIAEIADQELIRKVHGDQLKYLTGKQIKHVTKEQVPRLQQNQLPDLPNNLLPLLTEEQVQMLPANRLPDLPKELLPYLTTEQIQKLEDPKQMNNLPDGQFNQLTEEQLVAAIQQTSDAQEKMSRETVQGITKKELFKLLQPSLRDLLTDSQLKTFQVDVNELGGSRIAEIADQELIRKVNGDRLKYLTGKQIKHASTTQLAQIPDDRLNEFSQEDIAKLGEIVLAKAKESIHTPEEFSHCANVLRKLDALPRQTETVSQVTLCKNYLMGMHIMWAARIALATLAVVLLLGIASTICGILCGFLGPIVAVPLLLITIALLLGEIPLARYVRRIESARANVDPLIKILENR